MANLNDLDDVTISNPKVGDVVKYTANGWQNGADAGGEGVNGNPCGNLDNYTRDDESEVITEPWTWNVDSNEGIDVNSPDGSANILGNKVSVGTSGSSVSLEATSQGHSLIKAMRQLKFQDVEVPDGISLAQLIALGGNSGGGNNNGGGGSVNGTPILSKLFRFGGSTLGYQESVDGWSAYTGGGPVNVMDRRIFDWRVSDEMNITLPDWATGCAIIYFQAAGWSFSDNITSHPLYQAEWIGNWRQYTSHRVVCTGGEFIVGNNTGYSMANIINLNVTSKIDAGSTAPGTRLAYGETSNFQILRLTGDSKSFKLQQKIDFLYGGWNKMKLKPGKVMILPMVIGWDAPDTSYESDALNSPASFVYSTEEEYQEIIDNLYPPYSDTDLELQDTSDLKSAIIIALNVCNDALAEAPNDDIEVIRSNLYDLKSETSLDFAEARFKVLVGQLGAAIDWKFDWEPAGRSLYGGN